MSYPRYPTPRHIAGARGPAAPVEADVIILAMDRAEETVAAIASARAQTGVTKHVWIADQGSSEANLARLAEAVETRRMRRWFGSTATTASPAGGTVRRPSASRPWSSPSTTMPSSSVRTPLARSVRVLREEPDIAAIACRILIWSTGEDDLSSWGYPMGLLAQSAGQFDAATFVGAGHAIRRADFTAAGGYDDALFFTWEEFDLSLRFVNLGQRIHYRGDIAVRHKVSPEARFAWGGTRWFHFVRNRLYIAMKHGANPATLLPRFLAYQVKGAKNGVLAQGLRAGPEALKLARAFRPEPGTEHLYGATPAARAYLARTDRAHRGNILARLRREILSALPAASARR
jgi:GT2 family glycosyltransferase